MTQISFVGLVRIPEQRENPGTDGTFPQVSEKAILKTSERPVCPHIFPKLPAVCGEAALHSSQSGEGWVVRTSGGLGVEQFSPLRNRL
jgi:hypothetical protein